jgi:metal-sulfur cluster biosynthetic enzyme
MASIRHADHTDTVQEKLRLLQIAYQSGRYDLALSLTESLKDTITFERQISDVLGPPQLADNRAVSVADLPDPWASWARGWAFCKFVSLFETVGIARIQEPVELTASFPVDRTTDLFREIRVVRIDPANGTLHEIPCQVDEETRRADQRHCKIVFFADVAAHRQATYLVLYGNPNAERTDYVTDLRTTGQGYGLDIDNNYYLARLARQNGQLERLIYKREHSLELYAGGKGHGEPPGIDWGHDYVDHDGFQKYRMRNWADCPNDEVVAGPLRVRVRRYGFPHSPLHPVFTPSRMHIDQTYHFYAGLPYFLKTGTMEMVKDFSIQAMRDDEWVFSGYSFTDMLWVDRQGKLHEGTVPSDQVDDIWGVGFYQKTSRDAFIALRLDHSAHGMDAIDHSGPPTLHYAGHGQLWSRYPANQADFKTGTSIRQTNAYFVTPYPEENAGPEIESVRHRLRHPLEVRPADLPRSANARTGGSLARPGETPESAPLKPAIWNALRDVKDEQFYKADANVVDMGYIYDVRIRDGHVHVIVTMPHRGRPVYQFLAAQGGGRISEGIRERLLKLDGVVGVVVDHTWNPPWTGARLTPAGRSEMGLDA